MGELVTKNFEVPKLSNKNYPNNVIILEEVKFL